jgi:hypothetical protein
MINSDPAPAFQVTLNSDPAPDPTLKQGHVKKVTFRRSKKSCSNTLKDVLSFSKKICA